MKSRTNVTKSKFFYQNAIVNNEKGNFSHNKKVFAVSRKYFLFIKYKIIPVLHVPANRNKFKFTYNYNQ